MNFTKRVVATAALLASFNAAAAAALLDDPASGSAGNTFAADTSNDPQLTMAKAFLANGSPTGTTAGQAAAQPYAADHLASDKSWNSASPSTSGVAFPIAISAGREFASPTGLNSNTALQGYALPISGIDLRNQGTVTIPTGITLEQPKPRVVTPYYLLRDRSSQSAGR